MENVVVKFSEKPELENPIIVEGLPGIGLVGKLAADHLLEELEAKKFAEIYSPHLPPQVVIQDDGTVQLVRMELYYYKRSGRDIIFLAGGFQGITPDSQYQLTEKILEIARDCGVKKIYTLGGLGTGAITKSPRVFGAATSKELVEEHEKYGITFKGGGAIFGASGLLLGLSSMYGMGGVCLMGETHGQIIDAKSAEALLKVLTKILDVTVDMTALESKAKETEEQINRMASMINAHKKAVEQQQDFVEEAPSYYIR